MKELVVKARKNESDMLRLVNAFEPLIKKCLKLYVKNPEFYEDAMQHGRMSVIQCVNNYDIDSAFPFQAYVKRGVYYSMRNFGKKLWSNDLSLDSEVNEEGSKLSEYIEGNMRTDETFIKQDDSQRLYRALQELSENHRKIIIEVYFNNKSMTEICRRRRCHYMTVVGMKDRALKKLKEIMEK